MNKSLLILVAVGLQIAVLAGMLVNASMPLWTGSEIRLRTAPVDPRSLFRGNYARLNYDISSLPAGAITDAGRLRHGEVVYVHLEANAEGVHEYQSVSLEQPTKGVFIRGRYQGSLGAVDGERLQIRYGIEAYFAPQEKALDLEKRLRRSGAIARVMVASNGKPALESIE